MANQIQEFDEVLEASKKLDPTLRKSFLLAIGIHARIVRAFPFDGDRADPGATTTKRLGPLQKLLASFHRQVIQGIDRTLVPLMLAEFHIVNHVLIQLPPADIGQTHEAEESPLPQTAVSSKILGLDTAVEFCQDKPKITGDCELELDGDYVEITLSNQDHLICLSP